MSSMQISLPRMTNKQFDYVEDQARKRHISFKVCPTCGSKQVEISPGIWDWPEDATYRYYGQEYFCNCAKQIELLRHYILADIPKDYWTLSDSETDYWGDLDALKEVRDYFENWDGYKRLGIGLQIYSPLMGVGKTMLASLLAKWVLQRGESVEFISFRQAINVYQDSDKDKEERLYNSPVLIIDEVQSGISDAQRVFMASRLEDLLRFRTSGNSVTIITTNLTLDELEDCFPRCFSLLSSKQIMIHVKGEDVRVNGDKKMLDFELARNHEARPII